MPDVIITEFMDDSAVSRLSEAFVTLYDPSLADDPVRLSSLVSEARALVVRNRTQVDSRLLSGALRLSCVGRLGVGLDNIDVNECHRRGITVYPATGANSASVAEFVITAALVLLRGAWFRSSDVAEGAWPRKAMIGREVGGKTLGLVGFGGIARETAARARALGMRIVASDPYLDTDHPAWETAKRLCIDSVFREADVLSLHVPLTSETRRLANETRIQLMRPGAVLINTSRGGVVDEAALAEALAAGRIAGAALDVFEREPLPAGDGMRFRGLNVILTPHIAGLTEESGARVGDLVSRRVLEHLTS